MPVFYIKLRVEELLQTIFLF